MKEKIKVDGWRCLRCGWIWVARKKERPRFCPNQKCRSIYWDRPRKNSKVKRTEKLDQTKSQS